MQRWGYANNRIKCVETPTPTSSIVSIVSPPPPTPASERECVFRVKYDGYLCGNEHVAVVGNCTSLGNWLVENCVLLFREDESNIWSAVVTVRCVPPIEYRYLICAENPLTGVRIVRRWETHLLPRILQEFNEIENPTIDIFGLLNGKIFNDRGWLTTGVIVQLKIFNAPFHLNQTSKCPRLYYVKIKPVYLKASHVCDLTFNRGVTPDSLESSSSNIYRTTCEVSDKLNPAIAFNEVVHLNVEDSELHPQPEYGVPCGPDDLVIFHFTIEHFRTTGYNIDLYLYGSHATHDEPPIHVGYQTLGARDFKCSEGRFNVPITCAFKHRPIGHITIDFLIVFPTPDLHCDMSISYERYWNPEKIGLYVGHRGLGPSFKTANNCLVRENTIVSLKSAVEEGAHMVEFDVQLSKDRVPIVHHNFHTHFTLKKQKFLKTMNIPVRLLTAKQLNELKVYRIEAEEEVEEGMGEEEEMTHCCFNRELDEHLPFPKMSELFEALPTYVGFNIEIKWAQRLEDGKFEDGSQRVMDRNEYLDVILREIFEYSKSRRIVITCFDADTCTMLRYKQNRFPVMLASAGGASDHVKYRDPRPNSLDTAIYHASAMELLGVVANSEGIIKDPSQIGMAITRGLVLFCWGENNNEKIFYMLKNLGLHAIIYDKMDMMVDRVTENGIFQLQADESFNEELEMQAKELNR